MANAWTSWLDAIIDHGASLVEGFNGLVKAPTDVPIAFETRGYYWVVSPHEGEGLAKTRRILASIPKDGVVIRRIKYTLDDYNCPGCKQLLSKCTCHKWWKPRSRH
jgi:hypothetical protein